jgi:hypothetical protein
MYSLKIANAAPAHDIAAQIDDLDYEYDDETGIVIGSYYDICEFIALIDPNDDINYHSLLNDDIKPVIV